MSGDCIRAKYGLLSDNSLEVRNSQRKPGASETGDDSKAFGKATCPKGTGECYVSFFWIDKNDYSIVETDYTSYSVVRGCEDFIFGLFRQEVYWILVRDANAGTSVTNIAQALLQSRAPHYDQAANHFYPYRGGSCPYRA